MLSALSSMFFSPRARTTSCPVAICRADRSTPTKRPSGRARARGLPGRLRLEVVTGPDGAAEPAGFLLLLVLELDLREVQADLVGRDNVAVAAAAGLVRGDQQFLHDDLQELHLLLPRLAAGE